MEQNYKMLLCCILFRTLRDNDVTVMSITYLYDVSIHTCCFI